MGNRGCGIELSQNNPTSAEREPVPDIELDPKDYRAKPIKGEPIFHKGGPKKVLLFFVMIGGMVGLNILLSPVYWFIHDHIMTPIVCGALGCP
jgi:hypothetical protein